jgi:hypothetical protein
MRAGESVSMDQKTSQAWHIFDHTDAMAQHQQRVKGTFLKIKDVNAAHVGNTSPPHKFDSSRADVDSRDRHPLRLKNKAVNPRSSSNVQHMALAEFDGGEFNGDEFVHGPEKVARRQWFFEPVIATNADLG